MSTQIKATACGAIISVYCAGADRGIRAQLDGFDGDLRTHDDLLALRRAIGRAIKQIEASDREYLRARMAQLAGREVTP